MAIIKMMGREGDEIRGGKIKLAPPQKKMLAPVLMEKNLILFCTELKSMEDS